LKIKEVVYKTNNKPAFLRVPQYSLILSILIPVGKSMTDEILTLKEVAQYLKLAEKTAYRLAAEGKLPGFKVGGSWRFKREEIEKWIAEQSTARKE
jgi:excisionase family DNA binding protein